MSGESTKAAATGAITNGLSGKLDHSTEEEPGRSPGFFKSIWSRLERTNLIGVCAVTGRALYPVT
jgi:hypothetical protein